MINCLLGWKSVWKNASWKPTFIAGFGLIMVGAKTLKLILFGHGPPALTTTYLALLAVCHLCPVQLKVVLWKPLVINGFIGFIVLIEVPAP